MTAASGQKQRKDRGAPSLSRMVAVSLIVHLAALALLVLLPKIPQSKRIFYAPVMTVSFVEPQLPRTPRPAAVEVKKAKPVPKEKAKPVAKKVAKVTKKKAPKPKPVKKAKKVVRAKPKPRAVAKEVTRRPVQEGRRLDLGAAPPAKLISSPSAKQETKPKRKKPPPVESVSPRETKKKQPDPKKREREKIEERRRQWMAQQQEREQALLSKTRESLKEPEPVPAPQPVRASSPSTTGIRGGSVRPELYNLRFKLYLHEVRERVHTAWVLPDGLTDKKNLITIVTVKIRRDGTLAETKVEEGSGNRRYDETALRAIAKVSPLPALPEEYEGEYMELGFRFRPEGVE
jgi:colicin import membrane protein